MLCTIIDLFSKVILLKERFLFWKIHRKRKGGDHGVHQEIYNRRGKVLKLENHLEWKSNDCITIVGINKSSEQMIYYDSYQVLKLCEKF